MVGNLVRKGGSVLAALAIVAGGAMLGAGGAGAAPTGSAGLGSSEAPCDGCADDGFRDGQSRGDIAVWYQGPVRALVGQEVTFTADFGARYLGPGPIPDVKVATVTHRAPEGFEFTGAEVTAYDWTFGRYPITVLDSSAAVDPVTGYVTVTAPAGGWAIPEVVINTPGDPTRYVSGRVFVKLRYTATEPIRDGASGLTFTGTGVPASEGWVAKGTTSVAEAEAESPQPGGFGSSDS